MKITQIVESTTSGSVATVASPIGATQTRNPSIYSGKIGSLLKGKKTNKPYMNSLSESKMKDLALDLTSGKDGLSDTEFKKKYSKTKEEMRKAMKEQPKKVDEAKKDFLGKLQKNIDKSNKQKKDTEEKVKQYQDDKKKVEEAKLDEDDVIIVPGQGMKRKTGFVPHGQSRVDHEVEMAKSDLYQAMKNAKAVFELIKDRSEDEGLEGWVQEKIIKASDYLNTVREYLEGKRVAEMTGGVIAAGGVGEGISEEHNDTLDPKSHQYKTTMKHAKNPTVQQRMAAHDIKPGIKGYSDRAAMLRDLERTGNIKDLDEKAVSKAQQKFMGMVHAVQKGEMKAPSKAVASAAKGMTKKAGYEFAATKHKGLPEKVKKD